MLRFFAITDLFDGDRFFGGPDVTDGAHMPLAGRKLPEKSAVLLRRNSLVVNEPLYVAGRRRGKFDHLLRGRQDRIDLVMGVRRRTGDAKIAADMCADRVVSARAPAAVCVR